MREREREKVGGNEGKRGREAELCSVFHMTLIHQSYQSVTHASIYSLGSFLKKLVLHPSNS